MWNYPVISNIRFICLSFYSIGISKTVTNEFFPAHSEFPLISSLPYICYIIMSIITISLLYKWLFLWYQIINSRFLYRKFCDVTRTPWILCKYLIILLLVWRIQRPITWNLINDHFYLTQIKGCISDLGTILSFCILFYSAIVFKTIYCIEWNTKSVISQCDCRLFINRIYCIIPALYYFLLHDM